MFACYIRGNTNFVAILKSLRLQEEEEASRVRAEQADTCYAIIDAWQAKASYHTVSIEPPPGKPKPEDDKPFLYTRDAYHGRGKKYGRFGIRN